MGSENLYTISLVTVAITVAICRVCGFKSKAYQAVAHLFVGYLFGAYITSYSHLCRETFFLLCVVEVVCFLVDKLITPKGHPDANDISGIPR